MPVQHTMVPLVWRRQLGFARVLLGLAAIALYMLLPLPWTIPAVIAVAAYTAYSIYQVSTQPVEIRVYGVPQLLLDLALLFIMGAHPSNFGLWLSLICYFFLLCLSSLLYTWRNVAVVVFMTLVFFELIRRQPVAMLSTTVLISGTLAVLLAMQKQAFQERLSQALKRSVLSRYEAEAAREAERQRIGHDFHDGPLQSFISFQMRLEIIRKLMVKDSQAAMDELINLQELGKMQVTELRAFIRNMQPIEIDEAGLAASIREITSMFERDTGIHVKLDSGGLVDPDNQQLATEVLQLVREALNNVRKHSKASTVSIIVHSDDHGIEMLVDDDGSGFPFAGNFTLDELEAARLGPKSIKRRIRTLGGQLTLESRPSEGAGLRIRIPA